MRLRGPDGADFWLGYGMNVHRDGSVEGLEAAVRDTVGPLRERLGADGPFGLAIRLDADGVADLVDDAPRRRLLADTLEAADLFPFTGNAFVVGGFHDVGAKASVYRPGWAEPARVAYTLDFARAIAGLVGPGRDASLSTSPLAFRSAREGRDARARAVAHLVETGKRLCDLEAETGARVRLGLEPEPCCDLETTEEAIAFLTGPLADGFGDDDAARARVGVCFDVCHQAVEGEDVVASLRALAAAGVPLVKLQASCAIVLEDPSDPAGREALGRFEEPRWLHQVVAGSGASLRRAPDLPDVLRGRDAARWAATAPWRVHCHVPVHQETLVPPLRSTRPALEAALREVVRTRATPHLEVETYTFDALPAAVRAPTLAESLARELEWVLGVLASEGVRPVEDR